MKMEWLETMQYEWVYINELGDVSVCVYRYQNYHVYIYLLCTDMSSSRFLSRILEYYVNGIKCVK